MHAGNDDAVDHAVFRGGQSRGHRRFHCRDFAGHQVDVLAGADGSPEYEIDIRCLEHRVLHQISDADAGQFNHSNGFLHGHASITTELATSRIVPLMLAWITAPNCFSAGRAMTSPAWTVSPTFTVG